MPTATLRWNDALRPLCTFHPHAVILVGHEGSGVRSALQALCGEAVQLLTLESGCDGNDAPTLCTRAMAWIDQLEVGVTYPPLQWADLDHLPLPARHLLALEGYQLRTLAGDLQTTLQLATATPRPGVAPTLRRPACIAAELRSVSQEYGIRHYTFVGAPMTGDRAWLLELRACLQDMCPAIRWSAQADVQQLDTQRLHLLRNAGCEQLQMTFTATDLYDSVSAQARVRALLACAEGLGMRIHTELLVDHPTDQAGRLVALAATCGMNDLSIRVAEPVTGEMRMENDRLTAHVRANYPYQRYRQRMIDRFGPTLGAFVWGLQGLQPGRL